MTGILIDWPGLGKIWITPDEHAALLSGKSVLVRQSHFRHRKSQKNSTKQKRH